MRPNVRERTRIEVSIVLGLVLLGVLWTGSQATQFVLMADGPCFEQPSLERPAWADPNLIAGHLIACEIVPAGKYNRTGPMCDPCDWPIDVELIDGPAGTTVTADPDQKTWTIAGELPPGDYGIIVRGTNRPLYGDPNEVIVTVYVRAAKPVNQRPRLY